MKRRATITAFASHPERGALLLNAILVLAVLGIMASSVLPVLGSLLNDAREVENEERLNVVVDGLRAYYEDNATFPESLDDLVEAPDDAAQWMGPYVLHQVTDERESDLTFDLDAWRTPFELELIDAWTARLVSWGPDRADDNGGDDDQSVQFTVHHAAWEMTNDELEVLNAAITAYNTIEDNPLGTGDWSAIVAALQEESYLPTGSGATFIYSEDGWNQPYIPVGDPVVTSAATSGPPSP